jgi:hypothetical protein
MAVDGSGRIRSLIENFVPGQVSGLFETTPYGYQYL